MQTYLKSVLTNLAIAATAAAIGLGVQLSGALSLHRFLPTRVGQETSLLFSDFWLNALIVLVIALAVTVTLDYLGVRRTLIFTSGALLLLTVSAFVVSWFFARDILLVPISVAALFSIVAAQVRRLHRHDNQLTEKILASSWVQQSDFDKADDRLASGLKLLDLVLSPKEAVVFRRGTEGELVSAARLRIATAALPDPTRNAVWREGIKLCEKAIAARELVIESVTSDEPTTIIALPLRHEEHTVGALLIRTNQEFEQDDRALLLAVGSQMARNLQRDQVGKANHKRGPLDFFSATASRKRLDSLYVLNGALVEQRVGLGVLAEINDGVALAYLDGRIAYANEAIRTLAGLNGTDARQLSVFDLLDKFRTDVFDEPVIAVRRVLQTGQSYERELHVNDGTETLGLRISLVLDQATQNQKTPQPLCLAVIIRNLTRIKEYEQLKSDMISLMSHELRTPLTSINGFAELLSMDDQLPEQAKEFVTIIANESQRLSRMINTFLAVTKLERKDKQEVLKIPLCLDEVVKETITSLQPAAKKRRIRLVEQPTQRLPPVAADKSMITQAVKNLVNNAIKYSPERTTVTVSTALEAEAVRLCVEDRGYGIPTEARDRVWEKFYRVVREGQEKDEESTGLGLSFVREVVEQHGGTVGLESEVGRGSKFSFTLPRL